jgi:hypothetical protein
MYQHFLEHPELGSWLVRVMDDTILNVGNLVAHVAKLNQVYDPERELVFRGFLNDEYWDTDGDLWLGGGSGWLMSRPFVELHRLYEYSFQANYLGHTYGQDDSAETMIIQMVLPDPLNWGDPLWSEACTTCNGSSWKAGDFSGIPTCPRRPTIPMNAIVSFHPRSRKEAEEAGRLIGSYPENIHYYHKRASQDMQVCVKDPTDTQSAEPTVAILSQTAAHITLAMLS